MAHTLNENSCNVSITMASLIYSPLLHSQSFFEKFAVRAIYKTKKTV